MFPRNKVTGVRGSLITTQSNSQRPNVATQARTPVNASFGGMGGSVGAASLSGKVNWNTQYQYYMTGILPAEPGFTDSSNLALFYRDCYLFDNVAGSAVDIQSTFPFSTFDIRGLEDDDLAVYTDALDQLDMQRMIPEISTAYLVDGFFCGSLVFDGKQKKFMDTLVHDALQCSIIPSPFFNQKPTVQVNSGVATEHFLKSNSPFTKQYLASLPQSFVRMIEQGTYILNPASTLWVARRSLTDRAYVSYLHRILPMYLIEKTMFRGTLVEAQRRQRATTHITAGDDIWTPTGEELNAYVSAFQGAEYDALGGWIATRNAVQVTDIRPGGDFWKWTDMADIFVAYKLRALGISESFLSGDACLIGDTQISLTTGTQSIASLCPVKDVEPNSLPVGKWFDLDLTIPNRVSPNAQTKAWSYQGCKDTFTVNTEAGHSITGTDNHPFWVMAADGTCSWKRLDELQEGDMIGVEDEED